MTRDRETKQLVSLGDDLKAASTDALKKCATFLGVGLHLYAEKPLRPSASALPARPPTNASARSTTTAPAQPVASPPPPAPGSASAVAPEAPTAVGHALLRSGRVTPRQLAAIWRLGRAKNLEAGAVEAMSLRVFNRKPDALTATEASAIIKELSNMKRAVA